LAGPGRVGRGPPSPERARLASPDPTRASLAAQRKAALAAIGEVAGEVDLNLAGHHLWPVLEVRRPAGERKGE